MKRFPEAVRAAMNASGAAATCVAVQLDGGDWESALFFQLAGSECKADRRALKTATGPLSVGMETDLIETESGAVILLRPSIYTRPDDPFTCEILLTPGDGGAHFEALKCLTTQPRLSWFLGDQTHWILHSQQHPLGADQHEGFDGLLKDALKHDTMVRMSHRYDAQAALGEVVRYYELRTGPEGAIPPPMAGRTPH